MDGPWTRSADVPARHEKEVAALQQVTENIAIDLVIVAPLAKSIRTALAGFGGRNVPILSHPGLHQRFTHGTPPIRSDLAQLFPEVLPRMMHSTRSDHWLQVDFSMLDPNLAGWEGASKGVGWLGVTESKPDLDRRIEAFRDWLLSRPERSIAVVGHGEVLVRLSGLQLHHCQVFLPRVLGSTDA